jgi:hypothetical protein
MNITRYIPLKKSKLMPDTSLCKRLLFLVPAALLWASCTTVKPYQRAYLNDPGMRAGKNDIEKFDENVQAYREGASGGGSGKSSGGCGCN